MRDESIRPEDASSGTEEIDQLLKGFQTRDRDAQEKLLRGLYTELHAAATRQMSFERLGHTLQPTALVNEAYLKLVGLDRIEWQGRAHFLAIAARTMRRILVDHARARRSKKRGGAVTLVPLDDAAEVVNSHYGFDLIEIDEALEKLERLDERQARVFELRFFADLSAREAAAFLAVSETTVKGEYRHAKAWLKRELAA